MLSARLGLGCRQSHLHQLNLTKVIKCPEIHANLMPTWLQPRCICCKSLLRTVGELWGNLMAGGMLSHAKTWKRFLWEVFCLVYVIQLSVGWKHCKNRALQGRVLQPPESLCASSSQWLGLPAIWDHLKVQVWCFGEQWRLWPCIRGQDERCFGVPLASMFRVWVLPSNPQKGFIMQTSFWGQWPFMLRKATACSSPSAKAQTATFT